MMLISWALAPLFGWGAASGSNVGVDVEKWVPERSAIIQFRSWVCKIEFRCIWLICSCVEGLFQTGGIIKKSATSGVEGGLGSGEICISSKLCSWEGAVMLGDDVEQGGNKHN